MFITLLLFEFEIVVSIEFIVLLTEDRTPSGLEFTFVPAPELMDSMVFVLLTGAFVVVCILFVFTDRVSFIVLMMLSLNSAGFVPSRSSDCRNSSPLTSLYLWNGGKLKGNVLIDFVLISQFVLFGHLLIGLFTRQSALCTPQRRIGIPLCPHLSTLSMRLQSSFQLTQSAQFQSNDILSPKEASVFSCLTFGLMALKKNM